ncbi:DUF3575 domain-containing protein [Pedobacter ureilyticus]|jgi:hypothetical protein|uniref:DUF3575 domain-containing protein n=1 Tax=Pedobacter ureilyticus TaxID=1393051 RepID=A0ABW9JB12_9SPHI|nr:DUF3575 domain-containing protein [Pedobacter helvus]
MKKNLLTLLFAGLTTLAIAQENKNAKDTTSVNPKINGNNELKLNLGYAVAGILELNYERIIKDDMSIGVAALVGLEDNVDYRFGIIPNFRIYFGSKKASGFFVEGNAAVIGSRDYYYDFSYTYNGTTYNQNNGETRRDYTNFGLGIAAGGKFLTKNGFVGEIYGGVGRLFGNSNVEVYPRGGITIGKRF